MEEKGIKIKQGEIENSRFTNKNEYLQRKSDIMWAVETILAAIGENPEREGLLGTPERVARMYLSELSIGTEAEYGEVLSATFNEEHDEMVVIKDIQYYSLCVDGRTRVSTPEGSRQIRHIKPGDSVYSFDGKDVVETNVKKVHTTNRDVKLKIKLNNTSIECSTEHPVMTTSGWKDAGDLKVGDEVISVNTKTLSREKYPVENTGYSLGYILGAIVTDGRLYSEIDGRILRLQVKDETFTEKFVYHFEKVFNKKLNIKKVKHYGEWYKFDMYRAQTTSIDIINKIESLIGKEKHTLPEFTSNEMMQGYLDGSLDGDGSYNRCLVQKDKQWLEEISELIDGGKVFETGNGDTPCYGLYIKKNLPVIEDMKFVDTETIQQEVDTVQSIELKEAGTKYKMYDLELAPYSTFLANGILTKNCEHHMVPYFGKAHVAYIPDGEVVGLSKIARLVEKVTSTLSIQENVTSIIADTIMEELAPKGVMVIINGEHLCMAMRGIKKPGANTTTSAVRGVFKDNSEGEVSPRQEFLDLLKL